MIRLQNLDNEKIFAVKIRRNVASAERRRGFWKVYSDFSSQYTAISHLSAITDIMELVYFLVWHFSFNVSYDATNAIFSTPLRLYPFCSLFLPNSCVVRQCIYTVSYIVYWNFNFSIFLWALSQNISPSVIVSKFFQHPIYQYTHTHTHTHTRTHTNMYKFSNCFFLLLITCGKCYRISTL